MKQEFWKNNYENLTEDEWDLICSKCGKCCVTKTKNGNFILFSNVVCQHLDCPSCNCKIYKDRLKSKTCVKVNRELLCQQQEILPNDCAYKVLKATGDLPNWHPLKTGNPYSTIMLQKSINAFQPVYKQDAVQESIKIIDIVRC